MVDATVIVNRVTGVAAAEVYTRVDDDATAGRLSQSDAPQPGTANPIPIPAAGTERAWWGTFRLQVTANADSHTIDNLNWYSDGANNYGTGVTATGADAATGADEGYREATNDDELTQVNHTGLDAAPVDIFGLTSGSPRALAGTTTGTGHLGDHFVIQINVINTASPGDLPDETMTFQYDEA